MRKALFKPVCHQTTSHVYICPCRTRIEDRSSLTSKVTVADISGSCGTDNGSTEACCLKLITMPATQTALSCHLTGICVTRCLHLCKSARANPGRAREGHALSARVLSTPADSSSEHSVLSITKALTPVYLNSSLVAVDAGLSSSSLYCQCRPQPVGLCLVTVTN